MSDKWTKITRITYKSWLLLAVPLENSWICSPHCIVIKSMQSSCTYCQNCDLNLESLFQDSNWSRQLFGLLSAFLPLGEEGGDDLAWSLFTIAVRAINGRQLIHLRKLLPAPSTTVIEEVKKRTIQHSLFFYFPHRQTQTHTQTHIKSLEDACTLIFFGKIVGWHCLHFVQPVCWCVLNGSEYCTSIIQYIDVDRLLVAVARGCFRMKIRVDNKCFFLGVVCKWLFTGFVCWFS